MGGTSQEHDISLASGQNVINNLDRTKYLPISIKIAKTVAAEKAASKAYYSGRSTCSSAPCNNYANAVQRKAAEIEANL